ncbi:MAG: DUF4317 domain-containing protein [Eubacteriales bacterium]|nr:DUF4317 domain-containing protein [Eubacteriales bacterium]MDD4475382.1 DUF4317 domain-containing protein [Eubacteriales bacterium]
MNEREIAEIKRRLRPDKTTISHIRGCYVNEKKEIISEFNQSLGLMQEAEIEELISLMKKTLSGTIGKNLIDVEFSNNQVLEGEEHKTLMALRNTSLSDDEAASALFANIIKSIDFDGKFLVLLAADSYDVFSYLSDGKKSEDSANVFSYILCCVCPLKATKRALSYEAQENAFRNIAPNNVIAAPEIGFMFPSFDDRAANIYSALYYTKNTAKNNDAFVDNVFKSTLPMPAQVQKDTFTGILNETLGEDCDIDVVQTIQTEVAMIVEADKERKEGMPARLSKTTLSAVLRSGGVKDEKVGEFEKKFDENFGSTTELPPKNIVDIKQLEIKASGVTIKTSLDNNNLIQTKIIGGVKYILIRADEEVEINGVNITIK